MKKEWREGIATDLGVETKIIFLNIPEEIVRKRWMNRTTEERFDLPNNIFEEAIRLFEVPIDEENVMIYTPETDFNTWLSENF